MMCRQIYKTIWNDQWETAGILEKYHTVHGELKIIPLSGNVIRGGGGGRTKWGAPVNTVFANYLWESEQGGFYVDNSMQNVPHSVARFLGNGFVSIILINRAGRTTPSDMHTISCSFLASCTKPVWIVQFPYAFCKEPYLFCLFFVRFY